MNESLLPQFWYVIAESHEVSPNKVLSRQLLDEWLACYRDERGQVVVAQDRCMHRCARLSSGSAQDGKLTCRYHGWVYGEGGSVVSIPVEANGCRYTANAEPSACASSAPNVVVGSACENAAPNVVVGSACSNPAPDVVAGSACSNPAPDVGVGSACENSAPDVVVGSACSHPAPDVVAGGVLTVERPGSTERRIPRLSAKTYAVIEQDGYVYACLQPGELTPVRPFAMSTLSDPHQAFSLACQQLDKLPSADKVVSRARGVVRLQNHFRNSLANCVENYIDVPHTAYVHRGIFRKPAGELLRTTVERDGGAVHIMYHGERVNLGSFSWFLNPQGKEIIHSDHFYAPNITSVHYQLPCGYRYSITSQSIPISTMETQVYTNIAYDFGIWTALAKWLVHRQAQTVIDQDIDILNEQGENIKKYGERFFPTSADAIHTLTSEIIDALVAGQSPHSLSQERQEISFCV